MFGVLRARLGDDLGTMVEADVEHTDEVASPVELRSRREALIAKIRTALGIARDCFVPLFGRDVACKLGLEGRYSVTGDKLYREAERVIGNLREVELPEVRLVGLGANPLKIADDIGADLERLGEVLDQLRGAGRRAQLTQMARRRSVKQFRTTLLWVARTTESWCRLVDLPELAERLRPGRAAQSPSPPQTQSPPRAPSPGTTPPSTAAGPPASGWARPPTRTSLDARIDLGQTDG